VLDFTQEGILRKDDLFKVVFYPGADKREKIALGKIVPCVACLQGCPFRTKATNDTGCVRGCLCRDRDPKCRCISVTQLL
jgi:hypothetical protein